jgi:hypothetical protein
MGGYSWRVELHRLGFETTIGINQYSKKIEPNNLPFNQQ